MTSQDDLSPPDDLAPDEVPDDDRFAGLPDEEAIPPGLPYDERESTGLGRRMDALEERLDYIHRNPRRAVFTCGFCGTSEEREVPDRPTAWAEVLHGVREEIRTAALFDMPHQHMQGPAPMDLTLERDVVSGALAGLRLPFTDSLQRRHFVSAFFGWTWEIARLQPGVPDLAKMAMEFEQRGRGRADMVLPELQRIASPWVAARADQLAVERLLLLAWQRDMLYDALTLAGVLRLDAGVDVADVNAQLKVMREKLKAGPL
jgi:hypothetical protein